MKDVMTKKVSIHFPKEERFLLKILFIIQIAAIV